MYDDNDADTGEMLHGTQRGKGNAWDPEVCANQAKLVDSGEGGGLTGTQMYVNSYILLTILAFQCIELKHRLRVGNKQAIFLGSVEIGVVGFDFIFDFIFSSAICPSFALC